MFLHILRLVEDVSRPISHIIITNLHALSLRDHVHTPAAASDDAASKLRSVMRLPPPPHEALCFSWMKSPKEYSMSSYFFGPKKPMLSAPFIDVSPYLFYSKNICHLYSLLAPIKTIVNSILSGWTTHVPIFFAIAVAGIHLTNGLSSQKWLYILPSSFTTYWNEFTAWVEGGLS